MVKIVKNQKTGLVFTPGTVPSKDGKTYGYICLEQSTIIDDGSFVREEKRCTTQTIENSLGARLDYKEGQAKTGVISIVESFEPSHPKDEVVINPTTKEPALRMGKPFYRQHVYHSNPETLDVTIPRESVAVSAKIVANTESHLAD